MTRRADYTLYGMACTLPYLCRRYSLNRDTIYGRWMRGDRDDRLIRQARPKKPNPSSIQRRERELRAEQAPRLPSGVIPVKHWGWAPDWTRAKETQPEATT